MASNIFKLLTKNERSPRKKMYKIVKGERTLIYVEYKATAAYTYKVSHSRDLKKQHTKSD